MRILLEPVDAKDFDSETETAAATMALVTMWFLVAAVLTSSVATEAAGQPPDRVLEIRVYTLKAGQRDDFHRRFVDESLPLLERSGIDIVSYGPSLHDDDSYHLLRSFASLADRDRAETRFYASREWLDGPRAAVLAAIVTYSTTVVRVDASTLKGLRHMSSASAGPRLNPDDLSALVRLNDDYIEAVRTSNVARFREILADDFLCTMADGTLVNRTQFLEQAAKPATAIGLTVHDVNVRLLGDMAIVHAATTFTYPDGRAGRGRYTDVWARRNGQWVAVAAQFARQ
jgi:ketosteroid isomerase-like protein